MGFSSAGFSDPKDGEDREECEEEESSVVFSTLRRAASNASCSKDQSLTLSGDILYFWRADPVDAHPSFTCARAVVPLTVQVLITQDGVGTGCITSIVSAACTLHADAAVPGTIAIFSTRHGLAHGVKYTPFTGEEVLPCTAVTSGNDGLTDGCFSAFVVTTTALLPGSSCSRAFLDGLQCIGVFFALTTCITDEAKTALTIKLALQGPCVLTLAVDAECEAISTIRILGALRHRVASLVCDTALAADKGLTSSTVATRNDGLTCGLVSARVVTAAGHVPLPSALDTQGHIGTRRVFLALTALSAHEIDGTVPVLTTFERSRGIAFSI